MRISHGKGGQLALRIEAKNASQHHDKQVEKPAERLATKPKDAQRHVLDPQDTDDQHREIEPDEHGVELVNVGPATATRHTGRITNFQQLFLQLFGFVLVKKGPIEVLLIVVAAPLGDIFTILPDTAIALTTGFLKCVLDIDRILPLLLVNYAQDECTYEQGHD